MISYDDHDFYKVSIVLVFPAADNTKQGLMCVCAWGTCGALPLLHFPICTFEMKLPAMILFYFKPMYPLALSCVYVMSDFLLAAIQCLHSAQQPSEKE